jgi:thiol:disulfide interchange protein DsbA
MRLIQNLLFAFAVCGFGAGAASALPSAPKNGVEYETLPQSLRSDTGNKVEVIEFFSYACPHCNALEPKLAAWLKQNAAKVAFKRVHVALLPGDAALQRMFLTLEAMGVAEQYHLKVFDTIHTQRSTRLSNDEQVFDWVEKNGIERAKFVGMYNSFGAQSWVNRSQALVRDYKIDSWPTIAIGGRYLTSPHYASRGLPPPPPQHSEAELQQSALQVMDHLLAKAQAELK